MVVIMQMLTISFLAALCVVLGFSLRGSGKEQVGEGIWVVKASRTGSTAKKMSLWQILFRGHGMKNEIELPEGCFYAGNTWRDDVYLKLGKKKHRIFLNVSRECIFLTVEKGTVKVNGTPLIADITKRIKLFEFSDVLIGDLKLTFKRK